MDHADSQQGTDHWCGDGGYARQLFEAMETR